MRLVVRPQERRVTPGAGQLYDLRFREDVSLVDVLLLRGLEGLSVVRLAALLLLLFRPLVVLAARIGGGLVLSNEELLRLGSRVSWRMNGLLR